MPNFLKNKEVHIGGAGIAGLVAALKLKKNGFNPILYEKSSCCGYNRHGDFEGLETWNINSDPIRHLRENSIDITFNYSTFDEFDVHIPGKESIFIKSPEPFFHIVSRGNKPGDLDYELQRQVENQNIKINFNFKSDKNDLNIIATGSKEVNAYIRGVVFETKHKNQIHLILGNNIAPYGYGYLIIIDGRATLAVAYKKKSKNRSSILNNLLDFVSNTIKIKIENYEEFASFGSFNYNTKKVDSKGRIHIGEAGGFQDYLFGFGIQYAIESAILAAKSYESKTFQSLWRKQLRSHMRVSYRNRRFFERLNDDQFYYICKIISKSKNSVELLRQRCRPGLLDRMLNFF